MADGVVDLLRQIRQYKLSIENDNDVNSMIQLALLFTGTQGVTPDLQRAFKLLQRAIKRVGSGLKVFQMAMDVDIPTISEQEYGMWMGARRGTEHAQLVSNRYWHASILGQYHKFEQAQEDWWMKNKRYATPQWHFCRFGHTETLLPNCSLFLIAGEFEDWYDPDFYIYNDVIEWQLGKLPEIYCYPSTDFPPTDFHTTVSVDNGNRLIIIGSLGYHDERDEDHIQVLQLDVSSRRIEKIKCIGDDPGWMDSVDASVRSDGKILVKDGWKRCSSTLVNVEEYVLDPNTWKWEQLTNRNWHRIVISRKDSKDITSSILYEILDNLSMDFVFMDKLYWSRSETFYRIRVEGIVMTMTKRYPCVLIIVEGDFSTSRISRIVSEMVAAASSAEKAECVSEWVS